MKSALIVQVLTIGLPWRLRRWILQTLFGYRIDPTARIGRSLVLVDELVMAAGAQIGSLNMITRLERLEMREFSVISNLNYIYGVRRNAGLFETVPNRRSALVLGEHSALTSRHLVDCTDKVEIGRFCTVAGYRSTILTHSIEFKTSRQSCAPICFGEYSFVGTNCVILGGAVIPDHSLVAAGSVVTTKPLKERSLIGGVPAKVIGDVPEDWEYFRRAEGRVV